jgi:iron complex outermembrane receptor protein
MVQQDRVELKCSQDLDLRKLTNGQNSFALYTDLEIWRFEKWLLIGALRYETILILVTTNYKLASRYKLTDNINIRGASTGFRAPSLHQIYQLQLYSQMVSHLSWYI